MGIHARGRGPGDTASLPYFAVADMALTLERVHRLGGSVIHAGKSWSVCRDSEGTPFGSRYRGLILTLRARSRPSARRSRSSRARRRAT